MTYRGLLMASCMTMYVAKLHLKLQRQLNPSQARGLQCDLNIKAAFGRNDP